MLNQALCHSTSIVVVGASNDPGKPGGHLLRNLIHNAFQGHLMVVNPKMKTVQGIRSYSSVSDLPQVDLAILAISVNACVPAVESLARDKGTKGFIVISAGFAESGVHGRYLEDRLIRIVKEHRATLIGPNCIGFFCWQFGSDWRRRSTGIFGSAVYAGF